MSSKAAWVMLVCILQTSQVLCQGNACQEPLITGGRYRVEDEQITASSVFSLSYLPHEARLEGMSWCARAGMGDSAWIQVDFREDVIIQELRIGGDGGILQYYITQFRIEHGPNSDQLSSILQENSTEPMVFTRSNSHDVSTTVLPTPLTTRVLRIVSVVHSGSVPCVYLEVLGCALSPGCALDELLSTNRSLLPLSSITASTAMSDNPAEHVVDMSETGWCTAELFSDTLPTPYIVFNFTERVAITYMRASGGFFAYVTEFSLDYRGDYTDSYTPYTLINGEEAGFSTDNAELQTYTFWRQPLQGKTFRFKIQDGERNIIFSDFCWNVELFGCTLPEQDGPPTTDPTTSDTTSTNSPQQTDDTMTTTMLVSAGNTGTSTGAIVGGAVGGAIVVLLLSIIIVVLLVVCMLTKNRSKKTRLTESEVTYTTTGGMRIVNNEIYGDETPPTSPATKHMDINTYESLKTPPTEAIDIANTYDTIGSLNVKASSTPYESVGSPLLYTYAKMDTLIKVVLPSNAQPMTFSENSQQSMDSQDDIEKIVINTAYGSLNGANIEADMEVSTETTAINTACGSLMENAAYAGIKSEPEIVRKELIDNPLYDSTQI